MLAMQSPISGRSLADYIATDLDFQKLETSLMQWLETRDWHPITLSSDLRIFAMEDASVLRASRIGSQLCLQVLHVSGGLRVEYTLELAPDYQPKLERIRFENGVHITEVEFSNEQCSLVNRDEIGHIFEPEHPIIASELFRRPMAPLESATPPEEPNTPLSATKSGSSISPAEFAALEIEARYALHTAHADLGEPLEVIEVLQGEEHYIDVRGLVETGKRREELYSILRELGSIHVNIRTAEDAAPKGMSGPQPGSEPPRAINGYVTQRLISRRSPIQDRLQHFLMSTQNATTLAPAQRITDLSNRAVSSSQRALSEAWALRRLVERYGAVAKPDLLPRSRWLLEVMIRDHVVALETETDGIRELLTPIFFPSDPGREHKRNSTILRDFDWKSVSLSLFRTSSQIERTIRLLFADASSAQESDPVVSVNVDGIVDQLAKQFAALDAGFDWFASRSVEIIFENGESQASTRGTE
jgi:hypothetical protein